MEENRLPSLIRISRCVKRLADTSPQRVEIANLCREFQWRLQAETYAQEHQNYMEFHLPNVDRWFHVTLENSIMNCAVLPLVFWEDFDADFYDSQALYQRARQHFDSKFLNALRQAEKVLGPPLRTWIQDDEDQHRKALWQGQTCLVVLQQDDYNLEFGFDINFLLQPHRGPVPQKLALCA